MIEPTFNFEKHQIAASVADELYPEQPASNPKHRIGRVIAYGWDAITEAEKIVADAEASMSNLRTGTYINEVVGEG